MSKLDQIIHYFPMIDLPVIISDDHLNEYESGTDPFPQSFIDEFVMSWEKSTDEYTEFIPCFRLPSQEKYDAVVYWKGSLLRYDFVLATFDKKGNLIHKKPIAGTIVNDNRITRSVASIEPDLIINIIAGHADDGVEYDAGVSKAYAMEILPNGEIIFSFDAGN
jgi:hypothetical protein